VAGDAKVLAEVQRLARLDRIVITGHARIRMVDRGATRKDLRSALVTATIAIRQVDRGNWRIEGGADNAGDDLTVIVDLEADVIVVTLF
jgi:hypothetical protein